MSIETITPAPAVAIEEPVDSAEEPGDAPPELSDEEIDRILAAANQTAPPPKPPSAWLAWDAKGQGEPVRVEYRGDGRLEVSLGVIKLGVRLADLDSSAAQMRERIAGDVRELPSVQRWQATMAELAAHERALRLARATVEKLTAERNILIDEGGGGNLAGRLRDLDEQTRQARCRAEWAEEDVRLLAEAVKRQRQAAFDDVESAYASALIGAATAGKQQVEEIMAKIIETVTPLFDELVRVKMTRDSIGRLTGMDRRPLVSQLLIQLQQEVQVSRTATPVPPA